MKKKICLILLCLISFLACAIGLAACGDVSDSGGGSSGDNRPSEHEHVYDTEKPNYRVWLEIETCSHPGKYVLVCIKCGELGDETFEYGVPNPDQHIIDSNNLIHEATCKEPAMVGGNCIECGNYVTEYVGEPDRYAHNFTSKSTEEKYLKEYATCYRKAEYYYACSYCGEPDFSETFYFGELADHRFNRKEPERCAEEATCIAPAKFYYLCEWCSEHGDETFEYGEANPEAHDFSAEVTEQKYLKELATCQNSAEYYYSCSRCGESEGDSFRTFYYGDFVDHKFDREETDYCAKEATCTASAHYYYLCEWCDEHNENTFEYGEPLGHDWGEWEIIANATVDRNGKKTHSCYREDCLITEEEAIPQLVATVGLEFKLSADESYYACTGLSSQCADVNIVIPSSYRGLPVKTIETAGNVYDPNFGVAYDKGSGFKNAVSVVIPDSVTEIGYNAFNGCTKLENVTFGDSVETIKTDAFNGCSALVEIYFGASLKNIMPDVFNGCDKLLEIENSIFYVNKWVVDCYKSITSVTLRPDTVGLCQSAFQDCSKLTDVVIEGELKTISAMAFYNCSSLTNITIGSNVTDIEGGAFYNCNGIANINYNGDLKGWINISSLDTLMRYYGTDSRKLVIGGSEVKGELIIPDDSTSIGEYAFYGCRGITSVSIPNSIKEIGDYAFDYCTNLTEINYLGSIADWLILDIATNILSDRELYLDGVKIEGNIVIPNGITSIRNYAFYGCSGITSITIPNGVTRIGNRAFQNCNLPTSITIPDSVIIIGNRAFYGCSGITDLTMGNNVQEIGEYAFDGCTNLKNIHVGDLANWCGIVGLKYLMTYGSTAKNLYCNNQRVTSLIIPDGVIRISAYAFACCTSISNVKISADVAYIGEGMCWGWTTQQVSSFYFVDSSSRWHYSLNYTTYYKYAYELTVSAFMYDDCSYAKV